jgi:erythronate-4-phosphate dehydrogenase
VSAAPDRPLRIVADDAIGWLEEAFAEFGDVRSLRGADIDRAAVRDADVLLVRSVTKVDAALLAGSSVRMVGTATAGRDHLDETGLQRAGIHIASAPGCNATAVAEYVLSALALTSAHQGHAWPADGPVGIVGFGCVGRRLAVRLRALGVEVLACDPPLAADRDVPLEPDASLRELARHEPLLPLPELLSSCSVLTLHVPWTDTGPSRTTGLIGAPQLRRLPAGAIVINASRGGVLHDRALLDWLRDGRGAAILDVWQDEPRPASDLIARTLVATPHIAGYSVAGKRAATFAIHHAVAAWRGVDPWFAARPPGSPTEVTLRDGEPLARFVADAVDLRPVDHDLRTAARDPAGAVPADAFERLRRGYPLRAELSSWRAHAPAALHSALHALGVQTPAD